MSKMFTFIVQILYNSYINILLCSCSVACCKIHKETCSTSMAEEKEQVIFKVTNPVIAPSSLNDKISSSTRLQSFLSSSPYLSSHLPVLLARIDRHDASSPTAESQLARDLDKKERIAEVLKEAIETDPKVAELYQILLEENII